MDDAAEIQARLEELRCQTCWHLPTDEEGCTGCRMMPPCNPNVVLANESYAAVVDALESPPEPTESLRTLFWRHG